MSLNKSIQSGKEHRKQYKDIRFWLSSCRNHGKDYTWKSDRTHKNDKRELAAEQELNEYDD